MEKTIEKVMEFLEQRNFSGLKSLINNMMPADIALLFEELDTKDIVLVFRLLPKELSAETFAYLDSDKQEVLIRAISDKELKDVLEQLFLDDTVDIIEEMPANVVSRILKNTDPDTRKQINEILKYPEDSAGSIMTTEYVYLNKKMTVWQAISKLRREGVTKETVYNCYVTENRKLIGLVEVSVLLASEDSMAVEDIMETNVISVSAYEDKEVVARTFYKYDFYALPVVDNENRLVGIVTVDDAIDVLQDENSEDLERMAAMQPMDDTYFKTSVWQHAKKRIVWLMILMVSATFTGTILAKYESAFMLYPLLVTCIPMLMDTGGNSGSQSSTLIIRGIALDEIHFSDIFRVIFKEFRISLIVSVILAVLNYVRMLVLYGSSDNIFFIALIVSVSLIFDVIIAKFIGCTLPLLTKKLGFDPAIMASPIITTIVDACAMLIYFTIASSFLPGIK